MKKFLGITLLAMLAVWLMPVKSAHAITAWARKYNADCTMCHTMFPRLNAAGHKFRRLGYKMPDEFDSGSAQMSTEELSKFANYFSARGRQRALYTKTKGAPANFDFQMHDVTLFYAGPVTRNAAFFFELPFEPENGAGELEVGQLLLNFGSSDRFFFLRGGQFHQFSGVGFGALDRPIGLSRASTLTTRVNGFRPQHDGAGVELGYSFHNFTALVQATNGVTAAGTGSVLNNDDPNKDKDIGALLEYVLPDHEASVSALYVYGKAPTPTALVGTAGAKDVKYNRLYLFADYNFDGIGLKPIVGGSLGFDNQFVSGGTTLVSTRKSRSWFVFAELDQKIKEDLYGVARFDIFDPTDMTESSSVTAKTWSGSGAVVWSFQKFLRTTLEYQVTDNAKRLAGHSITGELQLVF